MATNRERYKALLKGWLVIEAAGQPRVSFEVFLAAVDTYETALREAELDEQYRYERARAREVHEVETPLGLTLDGYSEEV